LNEHDERPRYEPRFPRPEERPEVDPIIFGAPLIGDEEINEVIDTLRSGWLGTGPKTKRFEVEFAEVVGARYAVATNSGTAALHLALLALGVGPGDEVVTTPLTFPATANVIEHCGATPVFADVKLYDGNIEPSGVAGATTDRTKALLPVHYLGSVADIPALRTASPGVPIVADAAHAVESRNPDGSRSLGDGAICAAFSFYVTKNVVTGEGGMLVTDDEEIAHNARVRSLHGLDADAWRRYTSGFYGTYELHYAGFKYNMTDMQASLGLHQLARLLEGGQRRQAIWARYNEAFEGLEGVEIPPVAADALRLDGHAKHLYTLWIDWESLGISRQSFVEELRHKGVGTGWHFRALHLQHYYAKKYGYAPGDFPVAESIAHRTISLPMAPQLTEEQVGRVISAVRAAVTSGSPHTAPADPLSPVAA
jgi:dTDP-4-amino-4,6-dideoxygalactose transaminase